jgi:hypothetical protein
MKKIIVFILILLILPIVSSTKISSNTLEFHEGCGIRHDKDLRPFCEKFAVWNDGTVQLEINSSQEIIITNLKLRHAVSVMRETIEKNCSANITDIRISSKPELITIKDCLVETHTEPGNWATLELSLTYRKPGSEEEKSLGGGVFANIQDVNRGLDFYEVNEKRIEEYEERIKSMQESRQKETLMKQIPLGIYLALLIITFIILKFVMKSNKNFFLSLGISLIMSAIYFGLLILIFMSRKSGNPYFFLSAVLVEVIALWYIYLFLMKKITYLKERAGAIPLMFFLFNLLLIFYIYISIMVRTVMY